MKRRFFAGILTLILVLTLIPFQGFAASSTSYPPYPKIQYSYSPEISVGTIRYISQIQNSAYFNKAYWGEWVDKRISGVYYGPGFECGTCCLSMALSYIGINKTPQDLLSAHNGVTYWTGWGATYSNPSVSAGMDRYISEGGKYSPVVIGMNGAGSGGSDHYIMLIGRLSGNNYQICDPASNSLSSTTVSGSNCTYNGRSYSIGAILQWYNPNAHTHSWNNCGKCSCGATFDFDSSLNTEKAGYYTVTKSDGTYPRTGGPYDACSQSAYKLKKGQKVKVVGLGYNHYKNPWYKILFNGNTTGYVYGEWLKYSGPLESSLSINITAPYEGQTLPRKATNLLGTVTSNTNKINTVTAYLDGKKVSTVTVNAMRLDLKRSAIDYAIPFNTMSSGRHTIKLVATDSAGGSQALTRAFYTESTPCPAATVNTKNTQYGGKTVIIECSGANIRYTASDGTSGSGVGKVQTFIKKTTSFEISTTKSGYAENVTTARVDVPQVQAPQFSTVDSYAGTRITITSTPGAQIYYYFEGTSHGEYTGPFTETREITVYAYAVKEGMQDSETTSFKVQNVKPKTPDVKLLDTADHVAVGTAAGFKWAADPLAKEYAVSVYKDGAFLETVNQTSNVYTRTLDTAGKYEVSVKALSPRGNSEDSTHTCVTAMDPSTVRFVDDDGTLLAEYTIPYGSCVSKQTQPSHKGHYFSGWYPSNNYHELPVTQDVTYTATYTPIEYDVTFYDVDGVKFGDTQKVSYQKSATAPDYTSKVPVGYVFSGWTVIEASDAESTCDYTCVDANLKLQAVIRWENDELPIHTEITSAKVAPEGNDSVYTINVDATNWPSAASNVYLIAVLKTQDASTGVSKTVYAERVKADFSAGQTRSITIPLHYNGIAKTVEVYALERKSDDTTGSAYSKAVSSKVVFSTTWTNWSDWSTEKPADAEGRTIETKTEYRYQTKETTSSSSSSMSGWTKYDSSWVWSDWGAWSSWTTASQSGSNSKQVDSRKEWRYYYFYCPVCGGHEPFQGTSDCHKYTLSGSNWVAGWFPTAYSSSNSNTYSYTSAKRWTESLGDGQRWNFSAGNLYDTAPGTVDATGSDSVIRNTYRYRTRNQVWTYYFYRWTSWSSWSETAVSSNSNRNVESRTVYRYRDEVKLYDTDAGSEDTAGQAYQFTGKINSAQDLSGKVATIMVYQSKNMDPNQYQMQYVGQTTIQDGNQYSIRFIPIKAPTADSGNYVVSLGIQGTTGLLSVNVVESPKPSYTVRFLMDDGNVISTQTVTEGANVLTPATPQKAGYRFIGWNGRSTDICKSSDIIAQFEKEQFTVAFVDWVNQALSFHQYYYGDTLVSPYVPNAPGHVFQGWDALLDGDTTVKGNMVVTAKYEAAKYMVRFLDADGGLYQKQSVSYGEAATLPDAPHVDGKVFLGWSTDVTWWNVTSDMDVAPILAYKGTTEAPVSNASYSEYHPYMIGTMYDLKLSAEEGATIYYTIDGTEPTRDSSIYQDPIHLEETTTVTAMAVSNGKNDSENVQFYFIYDDTPVTPEEKIVKPLDSKKVDAIPDMDVPLDVELRFNPGLTGYSLILECDRSVFYIDAEEDDRLCLPGNASKYGSFTVSPYHENGWEITWLSSYPSTNDGILFSIPLKVSEEAKVGTYEIKLGYVEGCVDTEQQDDVALNQEMVHFTGTDITHTHSYTAVCTAPTCVAQGYTTHTCVCGDSYVDTYTDPLGHAWDDGTVTTRPTQTSTGEMTYTCTRCNETRVERIPAIGETNPFTDVSANAYYYTPVLWAVSNEITSGTSATTFSPDAGCTRAQVVAFLWRAAGKPEPKQSGNPFTDVRDGQYYYKAVLWAVEHGITAGTSATTFSPDATCTRGQIVSFLWRYEGKPAANASNPFTDVKPGAYYEPAVLWAVANGVTAGTSATTFSPDATCTRAQVVSFLYRDLTK